MPALTPIDNGDIWSVTRSTTNQRQGLFRKKPDGSYSLDEEPFRRLSRFDASGQVRSESDGYWIAGGDGIVRFDPRVKPSGQQSFATLVRQVSSGPKDIVFGGDAAKHIRRSESSAQPQFAAL